MKRRAEEIADWMLAADPESVEGHELRRSIGEELDIDQVLSGLVVEAIERKKRQKGGPRGVHE